MNIARTALLAATAMTAHAAFGAEQNFGMMSIDDGAESGGFALSDLMDLDVSGIDEIRFEQLPSGIFDFIIKDPDMAEGTNKEGDKIFYFSCKCEVEECVSLLEGGDPEALKGKIHNHRQNIEPADAETGIGRIRAFVSDVGMDSAGKLGAIVAGLKDHRFRAKVVTQTDKNDPSIKYARLRFEKAAK